MGFEPTTLRDLVGCSKLTTWATGDSMVSKGQFVGLDWNRIARLHSQVMIGTQEVKNSLTASRCHLNITSRTILATKKTPQYPAEIAE